GGVTARCVCAAGGVGGGGLFSAARLPAVWTVGGGGTVASGGDVCGSGGATALAAGSTIRRVRQVRFRVRHERRERGYCPTRSYPRPAPGPKDRAKVAESAIIIITRGLTGRSRSHNYCLENARAKINCVEAR